MGKEMGHGPTRRDPRQGDREANEIFDRMRALVEEQGGASTRKVALEHPNPTPHKSRG
jgi:hypothetical protein